MQLTLIDSMILFGVGMIIGGLYTISLPWAVVVGGVLLTAVGLYRRLR